jgi:hypothetical protein
MDSGAVCMGFPLLSIRNYVNESAEFKMSFVSHKRIVNFMFTYTSREFMIKICVTELFL